MHVNQNLEHYLACCKFSINVRYCEYFSRSHSKIAGKNKTKSNISCPPLEYFKHCCHGNSRNHYHCVPMMCQMDIGYYLYMFLTLFSLILRDCRISCFIKKLRLKEERGVPRVKPSGGRKQERRCLPNLRSVLCIHPGPCTTGEGL